eukprot:Rmarinus@m.15494
MAVAWRLMCARAMRPSLARMKATSAILSLVALLMSVMDMARALSPTCVHVTRIHRAGFFGLVLAATRPCVQRTHQEPYAATMARALARLRANVTSGSLGRRVTRMCVRSLRARRRKRVCALKTLSLCVWKHVIVNMARALTVRQRARAMKGILVPRVTRRLRCHSYRDPS